ncbi:MAG: hypothetical protein QM749_10465 [Aquabacterium sp.]
MPKIAQLVQSPEDEAVIVELVPDEEGILTGFMGGCCSVVVLWGGLDTDGYKCVRGHHAGGGPEAVAWSKLFAGVPAGGDVKLVMACAPGDFTGPYSYQNKVNAALDERGFKGAREYHGFANAYIARGGWALPFSELEKKGGAFTIRNKDATPVF